MSPVRTRLKDEGPCLTVAVGSSSLPVPTNRYEIVYWERRVKCPGAASEEGVGGIFSELVAGFA